MAVLIISVKAAILIFGVVLGVVITGGSFLLIVSHYDFAPLILAVGMEAMYLLAVGIEVLSRWTNTLPL